MTPACLYGYTYSKSKDQPGKVASPKRVQMNRENVYFKRVLPSQVTMDQLVCTSLSHTHYTIIGMKWAW